MLSAWCLSLSAHRHQPAVVEGRQCRHTDANADDGILGSLGRTEQVRKRKLRLQQQIASSNAQQNAKLNLH